MTEIRTIRMDEAEDFLELLCDVFGLDYNRAHSVFFTEPMFDLNRKWALFEGREMISILTTSPLIFGWGRAFGIAGVATRADRQREGYGGRLLERVLLEGRRRGEPASLLFAREPMLYERCGYRRLDEVVRAGLDCHPEHPGPAVSSDEARQIYDAWALADPERLQRDEQRWSYWNWHFRVCSRLPTGYLCYEPNLLREAIFTPSPEPIPLPQGTEWLGLASMADLMGLSLENAQSELLLMGQGFDRPPQMFMTDQF